MGGGINSGTVKETVSYCLQIDLFNKRLFDEWGVLTSRGIQRRYWTVLSERRSKIVYKEYWLLDEVECKGLVKVSIKSDMQPTNDNDEPANDDMQAIKKSKVNKSIYIDTAPPDKSFSPELEKAFQLFLVCRKQNGQNLNQEQVQLLREELCGLSDKDPERIAIVKKATVSNWKSFYPLKKQGGKTVPKQSKTKFSNFHGRDYDVQSLEKQLLNSQKGGTDHGQ